MYQAIYHYRDFILYTIRQENKASFAGTALGTLWSFTIPIIQVVTYYFLMNVVFGRPSVAGIDPFLIIVVGVMHYIVLYQILGGACNSIVSRSDVLLHLKIEPSVFIALEYFKNLRKGLEYLIIIIIAYVVFQDKFIPQILAYPFLLLLLYGSLWGPSLLLAVVNVHVRDVSYLTRTLLNIFMYLSPTIYHFTFVPEKYWYLYFLNPFAGVFAWLQWSLLGSPQPPVWALVWSVVFALLAYLIGHAVYVRARSGLTKVF